jgi:hypothetical protein
MSNNDDPTAPYSSFEQFVQSGACRNRHEAEAIWALWRNKRSNTRPAVQDLTERRTSQLEAQAARTTTPQKLIWTGLLALAIAFALWNQWYFSSGQSFRRFSDKLGQEIGRKTNDLYLSYFKPLGARSGSSDHSRWCSKSWCIFRYSHSFSIPLDDTKDVSYLSLSVEVSLRPSQLGLDQHFLFMSATEWWPHGTDVNWKIERARWSDEKTDLVTWQTIAFGNQDELHKAPASLRPLMAATVSVLLDALVTLQSKQ